VFLTKNGKITAVIEHIEDRDVEDYLLQKNRRFRKMLDKVKRDRASISLAEHRKSRGI
jgi:hydroxypyruvate isomerase